MNVDSITSFVKSCETSSVSIVTGNNNKHQHSMLHYFVVYFYLKTYIFTHDFWFIFLKRIKVRTWLSRKTVWSHPNSVTSSASALWSQPLTICTSFTIVPDVNILNQTVIVLGDDEVECWLVHFIITKILKFCSNDSIGQLGSFLLRRRWSRSIGIH